MEFVGNAVDIPFLALDMLAGIHAKFCVCVNRKFLMD